MAVLKLYDNPLSTNPRRVGIALLEKEMRFELVALKLNGDKF
jgi:glutathione S-transferase